MKDTLWRICGDRIPGTVKKRQGPSKSVSEVNDICFALKVLAEKDSLPIFLATSEMTPILKSYPLDNDKEVKSRLKEIEKSINSILDQNNGKTSALTTKDVGDDDGIADYQA